MVKSQRKCVECGTVFSVTRQILNSQEPFICAKCKNASKVRKSRSKEIETKDTAEVTDPDFNSWMMGGKKKEKKSTSKK